MINANRITFITDTIIKILGNEIYFLHYCDYYEKKITLKRNLKRMEISLKFDTYLIDEKKFFKKLNKAIGSYLKDLKISVFIKSNDYNLIINIRKEHTKRVNHKQSEFIYYPIKREYVHEILKNGIIPIKKVKYPILPNIMVFLDLNGTYYNDYKGFNLKEDTIIKIKTEYLKNKFWKTYSKYIYNNLEKIKTYEKIEAEHLTLMTNKEIKEVYYLFKL